VIELTLEGDDADALARTERRQPEPSRIDHPENERMNECGMANFRACA